MSDEIGAGEAARILGLSESGLARRRHRGLGPSWTDKRKPGAKRPRPMYDRADVEAMAKGRRIAKGQAGEGSG